MAKKKKLTIKSKLPKAKDGWISKALNKVDNVLSAPQRGMTYGVESLLHSTGLRKEEPKYEDPSQGLGIDEAKHPWLSLGVNMLADPVNLLGVGLANKFAKTAKVIDIMDDGTKVIRDLGKTEKPFDLIKGGKKYVRNLDDIKYNQQIKNASDYIKMQRFEKLSEVVHEGDKFAQALPAIGGINDLIHQNNTYNQDSLVNKNSINAIQQHFNTPVNKMAYSSTLESLPTHKNNSQQQIIQQDTIPQKQISQYAKMVNGVRTPITEEEYKGIAGNATPQKTGFQLKDKNIKVVPKQEFGGNIVTSKQNKLDMAKNGIHINPKNKGKFNATKKVTGKTTEELTHSKNLVTKKRAIFAQNAKKWKHEDGGFTEINNKLIPIAEVGKFIPQNQPLELNETTLTDYKQPVNTGMNNNLDFQLGKGFTPQQFNPGLTNSLEVYNKKQGYNYGSPSLSPEEQTQYNQFKEANKTKVNLQPPTFTPIVGNRYLQQSIKDFQRAGTFASNIGKQGNFNLPMSKNGSLIKYGNAGVVLNNGQDSHYNFGNQENQYSNNYPTSYNPQQTTIDMQSMGQNSIQSVPTNTADNTYFTQPAGQDNQQQSQEQSGNNPMGTIGGIAGTVANIGSGMVHGFKAGADIIGSQIQNAESQKIKSKLYTQSVFSQGIDDRPIDYINNRNALAENGKQIREIGGKGTPSINYESKEHILLPNGFSQEVPGNTTHAKGGINGNFDAGTKIFSEALGIKANELRDLKEQLQFVPIAESGTEIANNTRGGENTGFNFLNHVKIPSKGSKEISYATMAKPFETKKNVDMLESKNADDIQKNTANMMIKFKQTQLEDLFNNFQETNKINGKHGDKVQQGAMEDYGFTPQDEPEMVDYPEEENQEQDMSSYKKYGGLTTMAIGGTKKYKLKDKEVEAKYTKAVPADYKPAEGYSDLFMKSIPGTEGKKYKGVENAWWKSLTPEQKAAHNTAKRAEIAKDPAYQGTPGSEDYIYVEPTTGKTQIVTKPEIQFKDRTQYLKPNVNIEGANLGIPLPNVYEEGKLNYYKTNPNYIDPRYLNNLADRAAVAEGQRAVQTNIGGRGTGDISNLLQSQINSYKQLNQLGQQKWNYDRNQDITAQTFNAQAKTQNDQYNQGTWFNQLEDPHRRIISNIGDQQLTDDYRGQERFDQLAAYNNDKNYIDKTFTGYQNLKGSDLVGFLGSPQYQDYMDKNKTTTKTVKNGNTTVKEVEKQAKFGGKVGNKLKIKPKFKKK